MGHGTTHEHQAQETGAQAGGLLEGLAIVAGALAQLPAVNATCLPELERGNVAAVLADGWNLAAFTPTGAVLLSVLDAGGASIEVMGGVAATWGRGRRGEARAATGDGEGIARGEGRTRGEEGAEGSEVEGARGDGTDTGDASIPRATSHGAARAAWGAPPGRRIAAMGFVPGPDGTLLRMSCGLILRLPAAALSDPVEVAPTLAWHAAMHAAERRGLPAPPQLAAAIDEVELEFGMPRLLADRVAWAGRLAGRVAAELSISVPRTALA